MLTNFAAFLKIGLICIYLSAGLTGCVGVAAAAPFAELFGARGNP
jgi:hypothetical protein